jgi:hypothetical protein
MKRPNIERLKEQTRDLRREEPRPAHEELGGFTGAARCIDKCRATLLGCQGDYKYACPLDQEFLREAGLDADELKDFVATGASDEEIAAWLQQRARAASV